MLLEKPFAMDVASANRIAGTARSAGVFCMEAMWTRFLPLTRYVKRMVDSSAIGDVRIVHAELDTNPLRIVELADALRNGRRPYPPHDFTCHVTESTLAIQAAGVRSRTHVLESRFAPLAFPERTRRSAPDYRTAARPPLLERLIWGVRDRLDVRPRMMIRSERDRSSSPERKERGRGALR